MTAEAIFLKEVSYGTMSPHLFTLNLRPYGCPPPPTRPAMVSRSLSRNRSYLDGIAQGGASTVTAPHAAFDR